MISCINRWYKCWPLSCHCSPLVRYVADGRCVFISSDGVVFVARFRDTEADWGASPVPGDARWRRFYPQWRALPERSGQLFDIGRQQWARVKCLTSQMLIMLWMRTLSTYSQHDSYKILFVSSFRWENVSHNHWSKHGREIDIHSIGGSCITSHAHTSQFSLLV